MKVMVTGGSGFLGKALQKVRPDWIYLGRKDCDLRSKRWVFTKMEEIKPAVLQIKNDPEFIRFQEHKSEQSLKKASALTY